MAISQILSVVFLFKKKYALLLNEDDDEPPGNPGGFKGQAS